MHWYFQLLMSLFTAGAAPPGVGLGLYMDILILQIISGRKQFLGLLSRDQGFLPKVTR